MLTQWLYLFMRFMTYLCIDTVLVSCLRRSQNCSASLDLMTWQWATVWLIHSATHCILSLKSIIFHLGSRDTKSNIHFYFTSIFNLFANSCRMELHVNNEHHGSATRGHWHRFRWAKVKSNNTGHLTSVSPGYYKQWNISKVCDNQ